MKPISLLLASVCLMLVAGSALAQTGGDYDLTWWTVDGGGGTVEGSGYTLIGTLGQPEPGPSLTGGDYTLLSGFWSAGGAISPPTDEYLYLPLVVRRR